jgi:hypothetical protein
MIELNRIEKFIIEALGDETLTVEKLAIKGGYFRRTLSSLCKRGILGNKRPGYYLKPEFHYLLQDR